MRVSLVLFMSVFAVSVAAQEVVGPSADEAAADRPFQFGLLGFGTRVGADFHGDDQVILSVTLDWGDLYGSRLRLRPSGEFGFGSGPNTYVGSLEAVYRFTADSVIAVPYVGAGVGLFGQEDCGGAPACPAAWAQFVLGFELKFREQFNWLLEYHGEDALRRHRLFIGLTTRRRR